MRNALLLGGLALLLVAIAPAASASCLGGPNLNWYARVCPGPYTPALLWAQDEVTCMSQNAGGLASQAASSVTDWVPQCI